MQCWGRRLLTTAAHVTSVAMAHGRVAEERDSEYRAARAHEGALCRLVRFRVRGGVRARVRVRVRVRVSVRVRVRVGVRAWVRVRVEGEEQKKRRVAQHSLFVQVDGITPNPNP